MGPAHASPALLRFGVFEADLRAGELRRSGVKVRIQDLPFRTLTILLSRPNDVVTREELRRELWPGDVFVDFDRSISSAVKRLRDSLGDSSDHPIFVETIERHGYRWIGPVQCPERFAELEAQSTDPPNGKSDCVPAIPAAENGSPRWRFIIVLPFLALLMAAWIFWPSYRSAKGELTSQPASSSPSAALPLRAANREAEEFYLQGRYYWQKRTPESLDKAVDSFTQALVHDPGYAPAYVGLADCYNLLREYTLMPPSEAFPRALAAAKKAVELDDRFSEAHASLAFASFWGTWDPITADREFRRAIELNPNNAIAHHWYGTYLASRRRFSESLSEIQRAQTLDPASKSVLADKGAILFDAGREPEATALLNQMEKDEPDFVSPHRYLKEIYLQTRDYPRYLSEARSVATLLHDSAGLDAVEATEKGFANRGGKGLIETLRKRQEQLYERGLVSPYFVAETYALAGNKQEALRYLRIAYDQHADGVLSVAVNHAFDNLHNEPAFRQLLSDIGLPPIL
jgi:DNA-binding winged helix-turn-helix (wHTH) protein/Tfp pilus assembly protein PilF